MKRYQISVYSRKYKFTTRYYESNNILFICYLKLKSFFTNDKCLIYDIKRGKYL